MVVIEAVDSDDEPATVVEEDEEAKAAWKAKCEEMDREERIRVAKQFDLGESLRLEGNARVSAGDYAGACKKYDEALEALYLVGNEAENRKRAEKANTALWLNLALAYAKQEKYEETVKHCSMALMNDPKSVKALYRRGCARAQLARKATLYQDDEAKHACEDFLALLALEPNNSEVQKELTRVRAEMQAAVRESTKKEKELWKGIYGERSSEPDLPEAPSLLVRPLNCPSHLIVSIEHVVSPPLRDLNLECREKWCVGLTGCDVACRRAIKQLMLQTIRPRKGKIVIQPKPRKGGIPPEPISRVLLGGGFALFSALLVATSGVAPVWLAWGIRFALVLVLGIIGAVWYCDREVLILKVQYIGSDHKQMEMGISSRHTLEHILGAPLPKKVTKGVRRLRVVAMLEAIGFSIKDKDSGEITHDAAACVEKGIRYGQLSSDEKRIICILRALASKPEIIVCDDPLQGFGLETKVRILRMLRRSKHDIYLSILYLSDDLHEISFIAETMGRVLSGELVELGPTLEVLAAPRHPEMHEFVETFRKEMDDEQIGLALQEMSIALIDDKGLNSFWLPLLNPLPNLS